MSMKRRLGRDRQAQVVPLSGSAEALAGLTATLFSGHLRGGKVVGCTSLQYCVGAIFRSSAGLTDPFRKLCTAASEGSAVACQPPARAARLSAGEPGGGQRLAASRRQPARLVSAAAMLRGCVDSTSKYRLHRGGRDAVLMTRDIAEPNRLLKINE